MARENIASLLAEEIGHPHWQSHRFMFPAKELARLARTLADQGVEIGEIGATCAIVGLLVGKGAL